MAKKKLQPKRFYLSFELYTRGKRRKTSVNSTFVPSTQRSLPDINDEEDEREYGLKIDDEKTYAAFKKCEIAVREFAEFLKAQGEIE